jgi:curli biogenesis system outer membrane secretion channel CsgG
MGVARFKDVSARPWWTREIAAALADELAATLAGTGRLVLLGSDLAQSLAYEESGNGGAAIDELEGSALVVLATLTEYRGAAPDGSGPRDGPARVGMQLRLVDPGTARIVASSHVVGESGGAASAGSAVAESRALGPALAALAGTPAEEALRRCLREAASFVLSATPESYFRER